MVIKLDLVLRAKKLISGLSRPQHINGLSLRYRSSGTSGVADVIVGGGGIVGTSIAYHLAKRGKYVILMERDW
ncbi:unnamed protein product [Gongylonema pulchrum]|uniref:DAO domain-containing protein n=1 Tax=Gongylonema pulchrum TaxID=637853 RepID=A0A183EPI6_9BILA|nr:unnamed protein product [Gongylonema pulchrum]